MRFLGIIFLILATGSAVAAPPRAATKAELEQIREAMEGLLKDSDSAKFKDVMVREEPGAKAYVFCGMYNAKNSYGAYAGFELMSGTVSSKSGSGEAHVAAAGDYPTPTAAAQFCEVFDSLQ